MQECIANNHWRTLTNNAVTTLYSLPARNLHKEPTFDIFFQTNLNSLRQHQLKYWKLAKEISLKIPCIFLCVIYIVLLNTKFLSYVFPALYISNSNTEKVVS